MWKEFAVFLGAIVIVVAAFVFGESALSPTFQQCVEAHQQTNQSSPAKDNPSGFSGSIGIYARCTGEFVEEHDGGISALATIIIAAFTGTLWIATSRQARLTKQALIEDKRAFVFAEAINGFWDQDPNTGLYNWRFRPVWRNSGETPTRRMEMHTTCELRNTPLPQGFNFAARAAAVGRVMLAPKSTMQGGLAPTAPAVGISPADIVDTQHGRKFLYLWGWASYFDVFPGTPRHVTRFAWQVFTVGDPYAFDPTNPDGLRFQNLIHPEGNCADDECDG
jgi:hypothetical protein